jgi:hypothetical protein
MVTVDQLPVRGAGGIGIKDRVCNLLFTQPLQHFL